MEGSLIAAILILSGVGMMVLGYLSLRDRKAMANDFAPQDTEGLHRSWKTVFKLQRFNARIDIIIYLTLGPLAFALGVYSLLI